MAVLVGRQHVPVDAVVLVTGAWPLPLLGGPSLPNRVQPQRGQVVHLRMYGFDTSGWPIVIRGRHYVVPFPPDRVVVGATFEDGFGFDPRVTVAGVRDLLAEGLDLASGLADGTLLEVRVGLRTRTDDDRPVIGVVPGLVNVVQATGLGGVGLQLGPYVGAVAGDLSRSRGRPGSQ